MTNCRMDIVCVRNPGRFAAAGVAVTAFASVTARAGTDAPVDQTTLQSIEVTGTTIQSGLDIPVQRSLAILRRTRVEPSRNAEARFMLALPSIASIHSNRVPSGEIAKMAI